MVDSAARTIYNNLASAFDEIMDIQDDLDHIGLDISSRRLSNIIDMIIDSLIISLGVEKVQLHDSINGIYTVIRSLSNNDVYLCEEGLEDIIYNMHHLSEIGCLSWNDIWSAFNDGKNEDLSTIETVLIEYYQ